MHRKIWSSNRDFKPTNLSSQSSPHPGDGKTIGPLGGPGFASGEPEGLGGLDELLPRTLSSKFKSPNFTMQSPSSQVNGCEQGGATGMPEGMDHAGDLY